MEARLIRRRFWVLGAGNKYGTQNNHQKMASGCPEEAIMGR